VKLKDKVAIVVGGASGIAKRSAKLLAQEGAKVMIADLDIEGANKVADEIKAMGNEAATIKVDMRKEPEANEMVRATLERFGKIDILVNVAGGSMGRFILEREEVGPFAKSTKEKWDRIFDSNLNGPRNCTRAVINHMMERRSGKIVCFSSIAAVEGAANAVDYSAAKAGVIGFTKALAGELAPYGVQVNCITPSGTLSERMLEGLERRRQQGHEIDLNRLAKPEEIAEAVLFLASEASDHMSGQNIIFGTPRAPGG
jgi:NAD(P)-dependent dehydrogenase (short-subunit alcohol dehydrogenase family)